MAGPLSVQQRWKNKKRFNQNGCHFLLTKFDIIMRRRRIDSTSFQLKAHTSMIHHAKPQNGFLNYLVLRSTRSLQLGTTRGTSPKIASQWLLFRKNNRKKIGSPCNLIFCLFFFRRKNTAKRDTVKAWYLYYYYCSSRYIATHWYHNYLLARKLPQNQVHKS